MLGGSPGAAAGAIAGRPFYDPGAHPFGCVFAAYVRPALFLPCEVRHELFVSATVAPHMGGAAVRRPAPSLVDLGSCGVDMAFCSPCAFKIFFRPLSIQVGRSPFARSSMGESQFSSLTHPRQGTASAIFLAAAMASSERND